MTKPVSLGYMVTDCMTVRMYKIGMGVTSMSCCITIASISCVNICFSAKQSDVAVVLYC